MELYCGRSAIGERTVRRRARICPETMLSLVGFRRVELRTVRYWRVDGPLLESGQSAIESKILSRDVVVSGGLAE